MRKGTEPVYEFELPFEVTKIKKARVTVRCPKSNALVKKETEDLKMEGNTVTCRLKQEDTFCFECNSFVEVQLRVLTIDGEPLASEVFGEFVEQCLDNEVI